MLMSAYGVIFGAFIALMLVHAYLLDRIINEIHDAVGAPHTSAYDGMYAYRGFRIRNRWPNPEYRKHRELYPNSHLSTVAKALQYGGLIAVGIALITTSYASRHSGTNPQLDSDTTQSSGR